MSSAVSSEKAEKVVKPPSTPVVRNRRISCDHGTSARNANHAASRPIAREPTTFTMAVPHGKSVPTSRAAKRFAPCRPAAPSPPPRNTKSVGTIDCPRRGREASGGERRHPHPAELRLVFLGQTARRRKAQQVNDVVRRRQTSLCSGPANIGLRVRRLSLRAGNLDADAIERVARGRAFGVVPLPLVQATKVRLAQLVKDAPHVLADRGLNANKPALPDP